MLLYNVLLIHFTHGIALNAIDKLQDSWDLIRCHFLLKLCAQVLEFQGFRLVRVSPRPFIMDEK